MFEDKEEKGREEIIDYALKLSRAGLNVNSSGNLSVRFDSPEGKGFLIICDTKERLQCEALLCRQLFRGGKGRL